MKTVKIKKKLGLALGGGAARGFAHIGAIKAFEDLGIEFDYISGTSAGSMVGALYAAGVGADQMLEIAKDIKMVDLRPKKYSIFPSSSKNIENLMVKILGDIKFSDLKKPFKAVAVDIYTARELHLNYGSVCKAVSASCAVPGVFTPVPWDDYLLVDGGVQNTIPSDVARDMGAEYVIAVDINYARGQGIVRDYTDLGDPIFPSKTPNTFQVLKAAMNIMMKEVAEKGKINADFVFYPETKRFKATKLEGIDELFEEGYKCVMENIGRVREDLGIKELLGPKN